MKAFLRTLKAVHGPMVCRIAEVSKSVEPAKPGFKIICNSIDKVRDRQHTAIENAREISIFF